MGKYKDYSYDQGVFLPVLFDKQILPGIFGYWRNSLIEVILICDAMGLIGREMFAVGGCRLPSNASKEWGGTKKDFQKKALKLEKAIERIIEKHREIDDIELVKNSNVCGVNRLAEGQF